MARSLDIESLVEDACISAVKSWVDSDVTVKSWDDVKYLDLTKMVKIHASLVDDEEGTINLFCASRLTLDFGIFTSKKIDENGRKANKIRGDIRNAINQGDIVDILNTTPGLSVYNNGVIPQGSSNTPDDKLWQKNLSVLIVATTT